jgi:hypothetical protein
MSIVSKKLTEDPQYMEAARCFYSIEYISLAKGLLKKEVSQGRWSKDHNVLSYEAVKNVLIQLKKDHLKEIIDFEKNILLKALKVLIKS